MGNAAPHQALLARWTEVLNDPSLQNLPYKIELDENGKIEMSPATNRHGILQIAVGKALADALPDGFALAECSILTAMGVRVADVAWISRKRAASQSADGPYLVAPEVCVEIVSPSNTKPEIDQKIQAYLACGAVEVWIVDLQGEVRYHSAAGPLDGSSFVPRNRLSELRGS